MDLNRQEKAALSDGELERYRRAEAAERARLFRLAFQQSAGWQIALFILVMILWPIPIFNPIKLIVVLFHELSHVIAAWATGGVVFGLAIDPGGAGITLGMGGWFPLVLVAGYVGSFLVGAALYYLCAIWNPTEVWTLLFAFSLISLVFRWINEFTMIFAGGTIVVLFLGIFLLKDKAKLLLLRLIATTSCLYPILDTGMEVMMGDATGFSWQNSTVNSDLAQLAQLTGLPMLFLAVIAITAGAGGAVYMLHWTARIEAGQGVRRSILLRDVVEDHTDKGIQVEPNLVHLRTGPYTAEYRIRGKKR